MKILINYATLNYERTRKYCSKTAINAGNFDKVIEYSPKDVPDEIIRVEKEQWPKDQNTAKYGLYRPYIILKTLSEAVEEDYIFYCDAGAYFIKPIDELIKSMDQYGTDIMVYQLPFLERQWSKRDAFTFMDCDKKEYSDTNQLLCGFILIKNTNISRRFFREYYNIAIKAPYLFDNSSNILGKENFNDFIENRHNQTVFSLLCKKYNIPAFKDPSEFGLKKNLYSLIYKKNTRVRIMPYTYVKSNYSTIIICHRCKKVNWKTKLLAYGRVYFPFCLYILMDKIFMLLVKFRDFLRNL